MIMEEPAPAVLMQQKLNLSQYNVGNKKYHFPAL
jgi:hypothetical protein